MLYDRIEQGMQVRNGSGLGEGSGGITGGLFEDVTFELRQKMRNS